MGHGTGTGAKFENEPITIERHTRSDTIREPAWTRADRADGRRSIPHFSDEQPGRASQPGVGKPTCHGAIPSADDRLRWRVLLRHWATPARLSSGAKRAGSPASAGSVD